MAEWKAGRTVNLSAQQQRKAKRIVGGGRTEKVTAGERKAARTAVDIGQTKWAKQSERGGRGVGGLLVDASGKAVTGTVKLPGGGTATYVRGKRIGVTPKAKAPAPRPSSDGQKPSLTKSQESPAKKAGAGKKYEELKATVGGNARRSRKTPMTSPNAMDRRDKRPELGPSQAGRTKPLPGVTALERQINANPRSRLYPNKKVVQAQEEALDRALTILSMVPVAGGAGRGAMALRGASAAKKAAAARAAAKAAANRNAVVGAQARNAATRGLPSSTKRQALPAGRN